MRKSIDILSEIAENKNRISEYRKDLDDIAIAVEFLTHKKDKIDEDVRKYLLTYDMSQGDEWQGELENKAEGYQSDIYNAVSLSQRDTLQSIDDLRYIMGQINERISEALNQVTMLEDELRIESVSM